MVMNKENVKIVSLIMPKTLMNETSLYKDVILILNS
jgi:hypothetical protein